ncbi:YcbK family protein [Phenylobacterium sp.]|uniref:YcbK family protein n=1 Tax=Phenylobacterium sp. TaxID=1871053 RepID=UPI0025F448CA|nr:YcbK family protein [Phenylobacterium sp.]
MSNLVRRRELLTLGAAAGLAAIAAPAWARSLDVWEPRRAILDNLHTGEKFNEVYYANGSYLPDALAEATRVMRDWRTGDEHFIDPGLFDALHAIGDRLETRQPFQIISGYRSPRTNAMLHARSSGVAEHSQHTVGKAIDIRVAGVDLRNLRGAALAVGAGGVGFYPTSNFVHVDTGRVRQWQGS